MVKNLQVFWLSDFASLDSFLSPSRGTAPIAQIATWHNVIGLKGALGIISMLCNKSVTEALFWGGYWAYDALGLSSGIGGGWDCWGEWKRGRWGRGKSLNVCMLFFSPPVKDEKRHAVKDTFDFSASFFFPSHCLFFFFCLHCSAETPVGTAF